MRKSSPIQWVYRVLIYILGLFCLAMGVAFSVNANLGISPVNSLPYIVGKIINVEMGTCVTGVFCFYIVLQIIILRKEFQPVQLLQIICSTVFGYFVTFTKQLMGDFMLPGGYAGRLVMVIISILFVALGVLLYVDVELVPTPMEGLSMAIAKKVNKPFPTMKVVVDCIVVIVGAILSFVFLHKLDGIREGTVLTALVVGKVVGWLRKPLTPVIKKICFGESKDAQKA